MTIASEISRKEYAGDGVTTTPFDTAPGGVGFYFNSNDDVKVYLRTDATGVAALQTETTHYTLTGAGNQNGGTVTMITAPAVGETLVILHDPENKQELDLITAGKFPAESIETAFDKLVHMIQRNRDLVDRAITLADGAPSTGGSYDVGSNRLSSVSDPTDAQDAATMAYVQSLTLALFSATALQTLTADYTLMLTDAGNDIIMNSSSLEVITLPTNASVAFPTGTTITFFNQGTGNIDIQRASGVTLSLYNGVDAPVDDDYEILQGGIASIKKIATNDWIIFGNGGVIAS